MWLIIGQLLKRAVWWDSPLTLRDFSRSSKQNFKSPIDFKHKCQWQLESHLYAPGGEWTLASELGTHSRYHYSTIPWFFSCLNGYLYPTASLEIILDTFHHPETVQDRLLSNPATMTQSSIYPQQNKNQWP